MKCRIEARGEDDRLTDKLLDLVFFQHSLVE